MRDSTGRFIRTTDPLTRFLRYVQFDPCTGCVNWTGGTTAGQGHNVRYGRFWDGERAVTAHRWAAQHIHGLDTSDPTMQVDHECCNSLCVQHLAVIPATLNRELQWIRIQVGIDVLPEPDGHDDDGVPFYWLPEWMNKNA